MKKKKFISLIFLVMVLSVGFALLLEVQGRRFEINKNGGPLFSGNESASPSPAPDWDKSPISGLSCADAKRRPIAVMISSDAVARPLSGLSEADLVFEMPVVTDGITRLMAVFVCGNPKEIGSVRSARHDYISLARGLDAIYAHWGGSHFALDKLNAHIMDNIDALINLDEAFFRKALIAAPHNGFTSFSRLIEVAQKLGYRIENQFSGYLHLPESTAPVSNAYKTLTVGFPGEFAVKYVYDPTSNSYLRWRGGTKEIDKNNGQQVIVKNVVIMRAPSRQIEGQYNDVQVEGKGEAIIYRNGEQVPGIWKKDVQDQASKLYFYDLVGREIEFVPGQIWIEVVEPGQNVIW